jgi:hypothetical protein
MQKEAAKSAGRFPRKCHWAFFHADDGAKLFLTAAVITICPWVLALGRLMTRLPREAAGAA